MMKFYNNFYTLFAWGIAVVFLLGSSATNVQAQCSYLGNQWLSSSAPTDVGVQVELTACLFGGEYREVTGLQAGYTYRFETCGDNDFDTQLTIFPAGGGPSLAYNDDFCGAQSSIDFTPSTTGDYDVQVNQFNCSTNSTCMTLYATLISASSCDDNIVVVDMADSFGDGWNGNVLEIRDENDVVVASATFDSGSSASETFCLPDGCYTVEVDGGGFPDEVSWDISVNGNLELSGGAPEGDLALSVNTTCGGGGGDCADNAYELELIFDQFSSETSWTITDEGGNVVASGSGYLGLGGATVTEDICLPDGCYDFNAFDSFGDGMCCTYGNGGYTLTDAEGNVVASGGDFGAEETTAFGAGAGCDGGGGDCEDNEVVVDLFDSFGDGWNGAVLEISDGNGSVVGSATLPSGSSIGSESFCLPDGCYTVDVSSGDFPSEVSWDMSVNGNLELSGGAPQSGLALGVNTTCDGGGGPTCEDGIQNGNETGVDCGGPDCPACPTCFDGIQNGDETGVDCGGSCQPCASPGDLPFPWAGADVGSDCNDFNYDDATGNFTTTSCGNNAFPGTTSDDVAFIHQTLCGDGEIVAKIESVSANGYAGLMIRETTAPGAKQASVFSNGSSLLRWEQRSFANAPKTVQSFFKPNPFWLKLVRQGDWVFGYYSSTGYNFQPVHASYVPMGYCVEYGLAGFSFIVGQDATATFSNVAVSGGDPIPVGRNPRSGI
jgi:hypothetical protein